MTLTHILRKARNSKVWRSIWLSWVVGAAAGAAAGAPLVLLNPKGLWYFGITIAGVVAIGVAQMYQLRLFVHQQPCHVDSPIPES